MPSPEARHGGQAHLIEIFSSFQGEGKYVGERQLFIRFAGCNLACDYCDTPGSIDLPQTFKLFSDPVSSRSETLNNPVSQQKLLELVFSFLEKKGAHHSVCLTGGEPLLQIDFIKEFIPQLKQPVYLETNGVLPDHLKEGIGLFDIVAMDYKLPSAVGGDSHEKDTLRFLEALIEAKFDSKLKDFFVKIVFGKEAKALEIDHACKAIANVDKDIELILQPASQAGSFKHRPTIEQIFSFHGIAKRHLNSARVIPQMHKSLGIA